MLKKIASLLYGAAAYFGFLGVFLYLIAFSMNLVPRSVSGTATQHPLVAVLVNVGLIALFGVQHTVMARPRFKAWWVRYVPRHLERSTFVLIATVIMACILWFWQPIQGDVWNITGSAMYVLYAISALGWIGVPATSMLTDHFELFGLRQVAEYALGHPKSKPEFKERGFYKKVRHPMMLSFLIAFWATPHMTVSHALFAGLWTAYILTGIYFEERDLVYAHGAAYRNYQMRVPKLLPFGRTAGAAQPTRQGASVEAKQPTTQENEAA
jgi:protein-S-isoprenylcysteine O-methyltransferase Ste14